MESKLRKSPQAFAPLKGSFKMMLDILGLFGEKLAAAKKFQVRKERGSGVVLHSYSLAGGFLGRPIGRSDDSNCSRFAVASVHDSSPKGPKGAPRWTERRSAATSASDSGLLTISSQLLGRGTGHSTSHVASCSCRPRQRLDQRQFSARRTKFARKAFRST
jgi:hypothetical protein